MCRFFFPVNLWQVSWRRLLILAQHVRGEAARIDLANPETVIDAAVDIMTGTVTVTVAVAAMAKVSGRSERGSC